MCANPPLCLEVEDGEGIKHLTRKKILLTL